MKRFFSALALCLFLLVTGLFIFLPYTEAETNPIIQLLNLPAPPPPNPLIKPHRTKYSRQAGDKANPPKDDAPIDELTSYWGGQSRSVSDLQYTPKPSEKTVERIMADIEKNPETLTNYLNVLPDTPEIVEKVKAYYDNGVKDDEDSDRERYSPRDALKTWLTNHSNYFSDDLLKTASQVQENDDYVTNQKELLALAHVDWEKARPIVERLYSDDSQPVSQTLARWALYKHALETKDSGDTDKYRDELKKAVEDKSAGSGKRDLAMDALVSQGEWEGRDEWYFSLLGDETLYNLIVQGRSFTGLTTIINDSPPAKYKDKMIELTRSGNIAVRNAAVRNLTKMLDVNNPDVVAALLPWLENPKWVKDVDRGRSALIKVLATLQMPESVPGLIAALSEKREMPPLPSSLNRMTNSMANVSIDLSYAAYMQSLDRGVVIAALGTQKDSRAIGPLRQVLPELQEYEKGTAVRALLACGGFSIDEQIDALEVAAKDFDKLQASQKQAEAVMANSAQKMAQDEEADDSESDLIADDSGVGIARGYGMAVNAVSNSSARRNQPLTADDLQKILGKILIVDTEPEEALINATINRIDVLDRKDPPTANALRIIMRRWQGGAVNAFLLKDLKNGKTETDAIIKLLSLRKILREKQSNEIYDIRSGTPTALGISACLIENEGEYNAILNGDNAEAKTAMLACARMIRAPLPIRKVAENLKSPDKLLVTAAEKYLESEDSAEARSIVLALHPNEAKILGATVYFSDGYSPTGFNKMVSDLYGSIGNDESTSPLYYFYDTSAEVRKTENQLKKELKGDENLLGVYAFDKNYVRIFNDKVVFSWEEDESRYHERTLQVNEFEYLKNYLASQNVSELPPFVEGCERCVDKELLMLGRQGGRRIYLKADEKPEFFAGLEKIFTEMREPPARYRYKLEKDVAGLEILYADDNLQARTLWKNGADLRVLIDNEEQRKQIDKEIRSQERIEEEAEDFDEEKAETARSQRREKREYENYSWQQLSKNQLTGAVSQPSQAEFIPLRDNLTVTASPEQWKNRAANIEIRDDDEAIYKIMRGQSAKIGQGNYTNLVITPDAHWVVGAKYVDNEFTLIRINLLTNKESAIQKPDKYPVLRPISFISSSNKILVFSGYNDYSAYGRIQADTSFRGNYYLLDAASGVLTLVKGEFRPLLQQTFRPLQPAANPDEFWAAISNNTKNQTIVGIYNIKTFTMKPLLKIPKISFDSMDMWADEAEKKIYFVYRGQVLSLPLPKEVQDLRAK